MNFITLLLIVKIGITGLFVAAPFLLLPTAKIAQIMGVEGGGSLFRLYGVAIFALLVGYSSAFPLIAVGQFPSWVAAMGLVSNGGAAATLFATGAWRKQKLVSFFVAGIAICLGWACLNRDAAMQPLW